MSEKDSDLVIYREDKQRVRKDLKDGRLDYLDLADWTFQDKFFAFLLGIRFFEICGASYPSPRKKEDVPLWFLLACKVQMKLHTTASFEKLPGILRSGAVLSRVKFNVGGKNGGFNNKNKKERETAVDHDTARKFYKDTKPQELCHWHNGDIQRFIQKNNGFDEDGIFILDQTHVVVPENENYKKAERMAVDEHGQRIDTSKMTKEQKKGVKYRPCYALSELMHMSKEKEYFIFTGYQWGGGLTDELVQGRSLVKDFVETVGKGVMKLLITDRGYIDGTFVSTVKLELGADVLMPLRSNMNSLTDAEKIAEACKYKWRKYKEYTKHGVKYFEEVTVVEEVDLWDKCKVPLHISLMKITGSDGSVRYWGLSSTFKPKYPEECFELYDLRTQLEERHSQIKNCWNINKFTSPHESLIEAHVMFTLLTYTLTQLYFNKTHLNELANKTIKSLRSEELLGVNNVIVYSGEYFGVFDLDEYTEIIAFLKDDAMLRLQKWIVKFKKRERFKGG
ncbi:MAG: transposase [Proteobacteria bacterium]|nr:transposase [Pseudomonadota bacterium]MBU4415444.1 transposase [Pseudomonadota bacterium]